MILVYINLFRFRVYPEQDRTSLQAEGHRPPRTTEPQRNRWVGTGESLAAAVGVGNDVHMLSMTKENSGRAFPNGQTTVFRTDVWAVKINETRRGFQVEPSYDCGEGHGEA